ncbi:hypothetical protein QFC21_003843 [Naganishia friedmannii]|uniref:Uncharacterized protein n=1 Tax=Naganishia friedmannii TaxID=89922 RepID=A0ACC2VM33_9TREE|nr:hypothetical protein QFC21_003843 [Naganishia friedmannii]
MSSTNASSSSSSGIPFNTSAHNFNAPSPLSFGFGGVNHSQQQQQQNRGNGGNHPSVGFGGAGFGQAAGSKISSPLATSFGFNNALTGTGFHSPHQQQQSQQAWTSPSLQQQYTSSNTFASAFASSSRSHQPQQPLVSPSPARTVTQHRTTQSSAAEALDPSPALLSAQHQQHGHAGNAGKRRRSPSEDDSMDRSSPTPHTPLLSGTTATNGSSTRAATTEPSRTLKRARADPSTNSHSAANQYSKPSANEADADGSRSRRDVRARRDDERSVVRVGERAEGEDMHGAEEEADLGVLLASLPSTTHLQILLSLLSSNPGLKRQVLDLIPAPELEFAVKVLDEKVGILVGAVPIGAAGVGAAGAATSATTVRKAGNSASFGFGSSPRHSDHTSSSATSIGTGGAAGTVSDGYILNRLRIPFTDFVQVVLTYLPYFIGSSPSSSSEALTTGTHNGNGSRASTTVGVASTAGRRQIPAPHPSITFQYLSHLTALLIQRVLPVLPASVLHSSFSSDANTPQQQLPHLPILLRALANAWRTWLQRVSEHVNVRAGMYAASMAHEWIAGIEELRDAAAVLVARGPAEEQQQQETVRKVGNVNVASSTTTTSTADHLSSSSSAATTLASSLAQLGDQWVVQVGWLIGRSPPGGGQDGGMMVDWMDEEL